MGLLTECMVPTAARPRPVRTILTPGPTLAGPRPTVLTEAGVSPRPITLIPAPTPPAGKARTPMAHGVSQSYPTETGPPTRNMRQMRTAPSDRFRARGAARPSGPRRIAVTASREKPPVGTCMPVATGTFTKTPGPVGTSTSMGVGARSRVRLPAFKIAPKAPTAQVEPIGWRRRTGALIKREPAPASATWTAIFKAGNAGEPAASASVISSARAAADAVSQDEGADGDVKR